MRTLTSAERRAFRAKAHHLHPFVIVGQHGLTPAVLHEIDVNLLAHELIKIRVSSDDRGEREALLARISDELDAAPVQHLGKVLTIWRPSPEPEAAAPKPRAKAAASAGKRERPQPRGDEARKRGTPAGPRGKAPKAAAPGPVPGRRKPPPRSGTAAAFADDSRARRRRAATRGPPDARGDARSNANPSARRGPASAVGHGPAKRPPRGKSSGQSRNRASSAVGDEKPRASVPGARRRRTPR